MKKLKTAKKHVDDGLEKIRKKSWAEPLGVALEVSAGIAEGLGSFVPGARLMPNPTHVIVTKKCLVSKCVILYSVHTNIIRKCLG